MCKFESSQKDESRWQSTDSSKAYRNTSAFKYLRIVALLNLFMEFVHEVRSATRLPIERTLKVFKLYLRFKKC